MAYFPFFIDIEGKSILIVGGGNVALRKAEKILTFGAEIKVIAPDFCDGLRELENVILIQRKFKDNDIEDTFAVISATNDRTLNEHIYRLCNERKIIVNTVDDIDKCEFIFPSLNILAKSRALIHEMFHTDKERADAASELIKCISAYNYADDTDIIELLERIKTSYDNKNRDS